MQAFPNRDKTKAGFSLSLRHVSGRILKVIGKGVLLSHFPANYALMPTVSTSGVTSKNASLLCWTWNELAQ